MAATSGRSHHVIESSASRLSITPTGERSGRPTTLTTGLTWLRALNLRKTRLESGRSDLARYWRRSCELKVRSRMSLGRKRVRERDTTVSTRPVIRL